ncbi:MAG: hypothetical protein Q8R76_05360 [Candidatus Omnitrophota bacterium]|nr:hypothetical protein [Candidatus Omnitrophota bacterium]
MTYRKPYNQRRRVSCLGILLILALLVSVFCPVSTAHDITIVGNFIFVDGELSDPRQGDSNDAGIDRLNREMIVIREFVKQYRTQSRKWDQAARLAHFYTDVYEQFSTSRAVYHGS